jgi:Domain of unknown function (DUF4349)
MSRIRRLAAVAIVALSLAACAGSSSSHSAGAMPAPPFGGLSTAGAVATGAGGDTTAGSAARANGTGTLPTPTAQLVRTTDIVIQVDQLSTAAARVRAVAAMFGGVVSSETTSYAQDGLPADSTTSTSPTDGASPGSGAVTAPTAPTAPIGSGESVIVLRIPVASLDRAVTVVAGVGHELGRTSSSSDVTADLADLGSRVKTQQASVDRVRALMDKASSLQDVVLLESELSRRQSDLDALAARQAALADQADLSTLTVTLRTPAAVAVAQQSTPGFVSGLQNGWRAVVISTTVVLVLLGAAVPVLIAIGLFGAPVYLLIRRRARRRSDRARPLTTQSPAPQRWVPGPPAAGDQPVPESGSSGPRALS